MKKVQQDSFGWRIRQRLTELSQTQAWLAAEIGVNEEAVSRWVNGTNRPLQGNLHAIAKVLGVTVPWLLVGANPDTAPIPEPEVKLIVRQAVDDAVKGVLDRLQEWLLNERMALMKNASRHGEA